MQMIASALKRLPARTLWKLSKQEVEAAGGLEALNLTENVKVSAPTPPVQDEMGLSRLPVLSQPCFACGILITC